MGAEIMISNLGPTPNFSRPNSDQNPLSSFLSGVFCSFLCAHFIFPHTQTLLSFYKTNTPNKTQTTTNNTQQHAPGPFFSFLLFLSPKHVLEQRKTHMCLAKSFTGFCGEPQISISFAQQKLLKDTHRSFLVRVGTHRSVMGGCSIYT